MAVPRYIVKSENFFAGIAAGGYTTWVHIDAGSTGRMTFKRSTKANAGFILNRMVLNSTGATSPVVLTDSAVGVIAVIKPGAAEKNFEYNIPLKGNLVVDNPGGADMTVVYVTP